MQELNTAQGKAEGYLYTVAIPESMTSIPGLLLAPSLIEYGDNMQDLNIYCFLKAVVTIPISLKLEVAILVSSTYR